MCYGMMCVFRVHKNDLKDSLTKYSSYRNTIKEALNKAKGNNHD